MAQKLLKRSEVKAQDTWKLEDIFESEEAWEKGLTEVIDMTGKFAAFQGKLGDKKTLLKAMKLSTKAERLASSLFVYAPLRCRGEHREGSPRPERRADRKNSEDRLRLHRTAHGKKLP